jgi:hypothetical protein
MISDNEICMQINPGLAGGMPGNPSHLTLTIESIDTETDEKTKKRFRCKFEGCPRTYSSAGNLKAHVKSHMGMLKYYHSTILTSFMYTSIQESTHSSATRKAAGKHS